MSVRVVKAEVWIADGKGRTGHDGVRAGYLSEIHAKQLLAPDQPDPETYYELWGLKREGEVSDPRTALRAARLLIPLWFVVSDHLPLLFVCGAGHVRFYERVFGVQYVFSVLRGSMRPDNPYPPLVLYDDLTGGSDDEQIVRLAERAGEEGT